MSTQLTTHLRQATGVRVCPHTSQRERRPVGCHPVIPEHDPVWVRTNHGVVVVADFPARSPHLNAIEHVWGWVKHTIHSSHPTNHERLNAAIQSAWSNLAQRSMHGLLGYILTVMHQVQPRTA